MGEGRGEGGREGARGGGGRSSTHEGRGGGRGGTYAYAMSCQSMHQSTDCVKSVLPQRVSCVHWCR